MTLSAELFSAITAAISEAVVVVDAGTDGRDLQIMFVNGAFEEMTGYDMTDVAGTSLSILEAGSEHETTRAIHSAIRTGNPVVTHMTNFRKNGTPIEVRWKITAFSPSSRDRRYVIVTLQDITEQIRLKKQSEQLALLHNVWQEVAAAGLDLDDLRQRVAEEARRLTDAEAAVVEEPEGSDMVYRAAVGNAAGQEGLRLPIEGSISGLSFSTGETLMCDDTDTDARVNREATRRVGMRSGVLAPLVHQGRCYGVLKVYSSRPRHFSFDDARLLELSSSILAAALFDAAAFDEEIRKRRTVLDATPIVIGYLDRNQRYVEANSAHEKLFRRPLSEIRGKYVHELIQPDTYDQMRPYLEAALSGESVSFEVDVKDDDNENRRFRGNLEPHFQSDGSLAGCYIAVRDVTDAKRADTDYLTGLPNRRHFERLGTYAIRARGRTGAAVSLLMIDIDHFKQVNDRHGHAVGDEVLKSFGTILSGSSRQSDVPCRWGGEEFAILLGQSSGDEAMAFARRLLTEIRQTSFGAAGSVTASVGVAEAGPTDTLAMLQERADRALYAAKQSGRDRARRADS